MLPLFMQVLPGKKVYFASDFHLGLPMDDHDRSREKRICDWLLMAAQDASCIFLLGDLFDTWFDYKKVVPRGFTRFLGTLAWITDAGVRIVVFTGNHDLWMQDYFQKELGIEVVREPRDYEMNGKSFHLAHGDGLGPGDHGYKLLKKVLHHPVAQFLYRILHPSIGVGIAQYFSRKGAKHVERAEPYRGDHEEWLVAYARKKLSARHYDYFIFGHRHLALDIGLSNGSRYINLGDWITFDSYAVFDGHDVQLVIRNKDHLQTGEPKGNMQQ